MKTPYIFQARSWPFTVMAVLLSGLLLAACGDNTATPAPAPNTTAAVVSSTTVAAELPTGTEKPTPLRIGLIPNQNPDTIKTQYASFKSYMEKELGLPVELFVGSDYPAVVHAMVSDKLDMAYFGGLTFLQARQQAEVYPIVTEVDRISKDRTYTSAIIVPLAFRNRIVMTSHYYSVIIL